MERGKLPLSWGWKQSLNKEEGFFPSGWSPLSWSSVSILGSCVHPGIVCPSWGICVNPGAMCPSLSELCVPLVHPSCSWKQELFIAPSPHKHHTSTSPCKALLPRCCSSCARLLPTPAVKNTTVLEPGGRARY